MRTAVTILGGSGASTGTGQGCSGYLVTSGEVSIVLDLGPGTLQELRKHTDFRTLDAVVLSHLHIDHMLDVLALWFALAYNPVRPNRTVPLYLPPGGFDQILRIAAGFVIDEPPETFFSRTFDLREYDPSSPLPIGDMSLTFAATVHYIPCWAIRVSTTFGDIGYTADTGPSADLTSIVHDVQVLIAEASTPPGMAPTMSEDVRGHLTAMEALALAESGHAGQLILTHMYEEEDPAATVDIVRAKATMPVFRAVPGLKVTA